jgi:DNA-binding transcriptional regulator/RsmH inhibitor MraZ
MVFIISFNSFRLFSNFSSISSLKNSLIFFDRKMVEGKTAQIDKYGRIIIPAEWMKNLGKK